MNFLMLRVFVHVAEAKSFSEAALQLGISKGQCSKQITNLEDELGAVLLSRTTRRVSLTSAGRDYLPSAKSILEQLDEANRRVARHTSGVIESIRIAAPISFTTRVLGPVVRQAMASQPTLSFHVAPLTGTGPMEADLDCAVVFGDAKIPDMSIWRERTLSLDLVASPDYLSVSGTPKHPDALGAHRCLEEEGVPGEEMWRFLKFDDTEISQKIHPVLSSSDGDLVRSVAIAGGGIALLPRYQTKDDVADGRLVPVLRRYRPFEPKLRLMVSPGAMERPVVHEFLEALGASFDSA